MFELVVKSYNLFINYTVISGELKDFEQQKIYFENQRKNLQKRKQDEKRAA